MRKLFGGTSGKPETALLFDIGSGSVGGALIEIKTGVAPKILYTVRRSLPPLDAGKPDSIVRSLYATVREVAEDLHAHSSKKLQLSPLQFGQTFNAYCVFSSLWYVSELRNLSYSQKQSFRVTKNHLSHLIREEEESLSSSSLHAQYSSSPEKLLKLDHEIIDVRLNGYPTSDPYGLKASSVDATIYLSLIPETVVNEVDRAISEFFHPELYSFHSLTLATFSVLKNTVDKDNFIFFDCSGELTDIVVSHSKTLSEVASFPIGARPLVQRVAKTLGTTPEEALSRLTLYLDEGQHEGHSQEMERLIQETKHDWVLAFEEITKDFSNVSFLPKQVYVIAERGMMPIFERFVGSIKVEQEKRCEDICTITPLSIHHFRESCEFQAGTREDPFLALESLFVNIIKKE